MAEPQPPKYVTLPDGRRITYARWQYEHARQQEATIRQVNALLTDEATTAVSVGANLDQQEYGGFLRQILEPLLDKYGNLNATAAIQAYDQARTTWWNSYGSTWTGGRDATRSAEKRAAAKITGAKIQLARTNAEDFAAKYAPTYDAVGKTDAVVNWAMKVRAQYGHEPSVQAMNNALTREVAAYHRDTTLFNAALDPLVKRVQRVAQASACEFCRLMALGSTDGTVRTATYAVKFHDHCHCTIQPLFGDDEPVRPDYYDDFEKEYAQAKSEWNGANAGAKQTLANMRQIQKAKANGTYLEESANRWAQVKAGLEDSPYFRNREPVYLSYARSNKAFNSFGDFIADRDNWQQLAKSGSWTKDGDELLRYVVEKQGFNGKPQLVDRIEDLGDQVLYRGLNDVGSRTGRELVEDFKTSATHYQGAGIYGNGTYFASGTANATIPPYRVAAEYAGLGDALYDDLDLDTVLSSKKVIAAGLDPTAKTMTFTNANAYYDYVQKLQDDWDASLLANGVTERSDSSSLALFRDHNQGASVLMALNGIDAWQIESNGYWVVLNRGALKVKR